MTDVVQSVIAKRRRDLLSIVNDLPDEPSDATHVAKLHGQRLKYWRTIRDHVGGRCVAVSPNNNLELFTILRQFADGVEKQKKHALISSPLAENKFAAYGHSVKAKLEAEHNSNMSFTSIFDLASQLHIAEQHQPDAPRLSKARRQVLRDEACVSLSSSGAVEISSSSSMQVPHYASDSEDDDDERDDAEGSANDMSNRDFHLIQQLMQDVSPFQLCLCFLFDLV